MKVQDVSAPHRLEPHGTKREGRSLRDSRVKHALVSANETRDDSNVTETELVADKVRGSAPARREMLVNLAKSVDGRVELALNEFGSRSGVESRLGTVNKDATCEPDTVSCVLCEASAKRARRATARRTGSEERGSRQSLAIGRSAPARRC